MQSKCSQPPGDGTHCASVDTSAAHNLDYCQARRTFNLASVLTFMLAIAWLSSVAASCEDPAAGFTLSCLLDRLYEKKQPATMVG